MDSPIWFDTINLKWCLENSMDSGCKINLGWCVEIDMDSSICFDRYNKLGVNIFIHSLEYSIQSTII